MDILRKLIGNASVWIGSLVYDISEYKLIIKLVDSPETLNITRQIIIPDINSFHETIEEYDESLVDSIIGLHWLEDAASICLKTETREIIVKTSSQPFAEQFT
jgi:hypothetical protein